MRFLLITTFFLISGSLFSQDYIIKKDGVKIEVKVKEVSSSLIKYRNFSQPEGPDRVIEISKVKEIIYEDGQFEKFDTPKPAETVQSQTPKPVIKETPPPTPEEDLRSSLRDDQLMKNGFTIEGIFGAASTSRYSQEQQLIGYDEFGNAIYQYINSQSPITYVSLNLKLSNKWYFNQSNQWRSGLQVNWLRLGINIDPDNIFESLFLGPKILAPLNIGWTNVFRLNDNMGIEANITGGAAMVVDLYDGGEFAEGFTINPELKFRFNKLSVGLDYLFFRDNYQFYNQYNNQIITKNRIWNTFGVTIGAKL